MPPASQAALAVPEDPLASEVASAALVAPHPAGAPALAVEVVQGEQEDRLQAASEGPAVALGEGEAPAAAADRHLGVWAVPAAAEVQHRRAVAAGQAAAAGPGPHRQVGEEERRRRLLQPAPLARQAEVLARPRLHQHQRRLPTLPLPSLLSLRPSLPSMLPSRQSANHRAPSNPRGLTICTLLP